MSTVEILLWIGCAINWIVILAMIAIEIKTRIRNRKSFK